LNGRVVYVSADRLIDQRTGQGFYTARVEVLPGELGRLGPLALVPGMPAEVIIKTGERTALQYLLQPLADAMARAWRES
jgi:HlyD family secretion protein